MTTETAEPTVIDSIAAQYRDAFNAVLDALLARQGSSTDRKDLEHLAAEHALELVRLVR